MSPARALLLAGLLGCLLGACATQRPTAAAVPIPGELRAAASGYVVVTIRNPVAAATLQAASTPRGYGGTGAYLAGSEALRAARAVAREYGLREAASWPIQALDVHCLAYAVPAGVDREALMARLARDPRVESVQPLNTFSTSTTARAPATYNDPYAPLQANMAQLSIAQAHVLSRGAGVSVAVIDTGADLAHPDLRPHGASGRNFVDGDERAYAADTHGTAVAGLIGAVPNNGLGIAGLAPDARLLVYKACWRQGEGSSCNSFTLAQALAAAIDARADVINLSLNGPADPLLERLLRSGMARGSIVVGALPPAGQRAGFPAGVAGVLVAGALESAPVAPDVLRAPGRELISLAPEGHYDYYSGSSLAAAEVSGVVALLKAGDRRLDGAGAGRLLAASQASPAQGVDACAALVALLHRGECSR